MMIAKVREGYKQTEVGVIPQDWGVERLCNGIQLLSGHHVIAHFCNTEGIGIPYLTGPADFQQGNIQHSKYTANPSTLCRKDDILVTVKGSGAGKMVLADSEYCISRQLMAIRVIDWDVHFLFSLLKQDESLFGAAAIGLIPGLSRMDILNKFIPLPQKMQEQTAIATALSDTDALIASLEKLIEKKRAIKQGAMQELLKPKEGWTSEPVKNFASISTGAKNTQDKTDDGNYPFFVRSPNIERINSYSFDGEAVLVAGAGVGTGKVMHYFNGKFDFHQRVYKISEFQRNKINGFYFFLYFKNNFFSRIMQMTAKSSVDSVRMEMIAEMSISFPLLEEQVRIGKILSDMDTEISTLEQKLSKYKLLKQGMMQELLTGKTRLV